ncbi:hypothetical protein FEM48_Zijuj11G0001100 [Ziziphus jujuba var. spinosa]|uniref:Caffeic acid 3-O-methyltransferase-like n=1 Tax=Ziziphus jujuba var. spinosa TaxID=714518 RepID=A0A978UFP7_ZIZJJ|nr:hypothetical protein FEM48_Zijuj11G0001100 [Ziziphus jujuba var. spinosa]
MEMESNKTQMTHEHEYAMQLASASVLPMVLKAAMELGVLEIIQKAGPAARLSAQEIASQLPTQNPEAPILVDRMLRLLSAHSLLTCSVSACQSDQQRLYALTPVSNYLLPNKDGVSLAPLLSLIQDKVFLVKWFLVKDQCPNRYHLKDAVLEGGLPFDKAHGMNAAEYVKKDASSSIFQLPCFLCSASGIEQIPGDMFTSIPKGGDAIFMKWILHTWDDEHCLVILKNCYEALPDGGKVIVVDMVIQEASDTSVASRSLFQFDMIMMNMNPTGKERTKREFENLAKEAGFSSIRVACSAYGFSVMEIFKNT